jgi:hypothetical protein
MPKSTNGVRGDAWLKYSGGSFSVQPPQIAHILAADGCGTQINTAYVERDNLTSRQSHGRLVGKTLSPSKKGYFLRRQIALEDAIHNFVRPPSAMACQAITASRPWPQMGTTHTRDGGWTHRPDLEPGRVIELSSLATEILKIPFTA